MGSEMCIRDRIKLVRAYGGVPLIPLRPSGEFPGGSREGGAAKPEDPDKIRSISYGFAFGPF